MFRAHCIVGGNEKSAARFFFSFHSLFLPPLGLWQSRATSYNMGTRNQLRIHSQYKIEADALPTCLIQYPAQRDEEEFLLTANS